MGPLGSGNVTKLFKNMVTASESLIVYEALQIAKAAGINLKAALDVMQKTKSHHVLDRWEMRFELAGKDLKFHAGSNLYDKDLPLAAEVGKDLGADIPVTETPQLDSTQRRQIEPNLTRGTENEKKVYRGHTVEFVRRNRSGNGSPARRSLLRKTKIPIFGRRRTSFDTRVQADLRRWLNSIDGRLYGANGCWPVLRGETWKSQVLTSTEESCGCIAVRQHVAGHD